MTLVAWADRIALELPENKKLSKPAMIGWAAGLFEGEGCFSMRWSAKKGSNNGKRYPALIIVSTDVDVLEKFQSVVNLGRIYKRNKADKLSKKNLYTWQVGSRKEVVEVIEKLWPFLSNRRKESILQGLPQCNVEVI